jgi:hypothetical protein
MGLADDESPTEQKSKKPPAREWYARKPFWDLRASHWAEILLTVALLGVGGSQLYVYWRQAGIMDKQASITTGQLELSETQERALIGVGNIEITGEKTGTDNKVTFGPLRVKRGTPERQQLKI